MHTSTGPGAGALTQETGRRRGPTPSPEEPGRGTRDPQGAGVAPLRLSRWGGRHWPPRLVLGGRVLWATGSHADVIAGRRGTCRRLTGRNEMVSTSPGLPRRAERGGGGGPGLLERPRFPRRVPTGV